MGAGSNRAGATRRRLLEVTAEEVLANGFRATGIDAILAKAGVTKGALYYHFRNKEELGLAMIDELYRDQMVGQWERALNLTDDPVEDLITMLKHQKSQCTEESVRYGCPVNNLSQEMAAVNEDFRRRIEAIFDGWRAIIAAALERGKESGAVRSNVDSSRAAIFITSLIEGAIGSAKSARDPALLRSAIDTLLLFVETLRPGRYLRT